MADRSAVALWIDPLISRWNGFAIWWLAGLRETVPVKWRHWFSAPTQSALIIEPKVNGFLCRAVGGDERQVSPAITRSGKEALAAYLRQAEMRRDEVNVGLLMERQLFFTRDIDVPEVALNALSRLLDQDILRRTPFGLSDVIHGATVSEAAVPRRGVTHFRHWIIRRDIVEPALRNAGLDPEGPDTLFTRDEDGRDVPVVRLGLSPMRDRPWAKRAVALAAGMACLSTVLTLAAVDHAQDDRADRLAVALADMRARIAGSNGGMDAVGILTIKADIGMGGILNELSKVMPDDTFLTELRVADGKIEAAGFSSDAARLVRLIDGSSMFKNAALAGAIEPNVAEGKDHFSIRADLQTGQLLRLRAASGRSRSMPAEGPSS